MSTTKRRLLCPHCRNRRLYPVKKEQTELDVCLKCGGFWLDHGELEQIIRRYDPKSRFGSNFADVFVAQNMSGQRRCPTCKTMMTPYKVMADSEFIVDACDTCQGIWLDQGELERSQVLHQIPQATLDIEAKPSTKHWLIQFFLGLPVEFNVKPRRFPLVTVLLILFNIIIFMYENTLLSHAGTDAEAVINFWALIPGNIGSFIWIINLFSYQFLHGGWFHLLGNMYFLYILGDNLEDVLGRTKFLVFYLACGVSAGLLESILSSDPQVPVLGASGAIAGIMAAYAVIFRRAYLTFMFLYMQWKLPAYWYFTIWIGYNLLGMYLNQDNVAWFAHLGGFVAGLTIAFVIYKTLLEKHPLLKYLNVPPTTPPPNYVERI